MYETETGSCEKCRTRRAWGRSPLCFYCLGNAELLVTPSGEVADPDQPTRDLCPARYRFRAIRCGKDCKSCPHGWYVYRQWYVQRRAHEQYLGPTDQIGDPYTRPSLRRPLPAFARGSRRSRRGSAVGARRATSARPR